MQEQVEKVTVLSGELDAARKTIAETLGAANVAVASFFGCDFVNDSTDSGPLVEASQAHAIIVRARNELTQAGSVSITSADDYLRRSDDLQRIKGIGKDLEAKRKEMTVPIDEAKKQIQALFNPAKEYLDSAETAIKAAMVAWDREQERLRLIAEQKAREEAERQRAAIEAEQAAARAKAEAEEKRLRDEAAAAAAAGDTVKAAKLEAKAGAQEDIAQARIETIAAKATEVSPFIPETVKAKGISSRKKYVATVTDLKALLTAVVAGKVPIAIIKADESALSRMANALSGELNYPGVMVTEETIIAARAK